MTRRGVLSLAALGALAACGAPVAQAPGPPAAPPLKVGPAVDLVPAAGLLWVLDLRPREVFASPELIAAVALVVPEESFDAFARRHGGIDLRAVLELAIASYPASTLAVARAPVDPARVEAAFVARAMSVDGRAVEGGVTRTWGSVGPAREQIAILGRQGVVLEHGQLGPLRAAEYFAQGRLRRALPALRADPLLDLASRLGDAPLRGLAPGPFEGVWGRGLGGLLGASTAVGVAAGPAGGPGQMGQTGRPGLALRVALTGGWGRDAPAAAERLRAAFDVLASDPLGHVLGLDRPLEGPRAWAEPGALHLEVTLDALALGRGLRAEAAPTVEEIMRI